MKKILSIILLLAFNFNALADCTKIKADSVKDVIFLYKKINKNEVYYIPFARLKDNQLINANNIQLDKATTIYFLKNDKPLDLEFSTDFDENGCHSVAKATLNEGNKNEFEIFATQPIANQFSFNPSKEESLQFSSKIDTPCSQAKPNYNQDGIMTCDASQLIAVSHLMGQKQFWYSKQYRYALGFAVSSVDAKGQLNEIASDCSYCAD
ncbi:MAG: hypothetical protein LCH30_09475 [Proteobacteria bacterium]|nr:hypothetical protein [Pseudomonadota bacterium]